MRLILHNIKELVQVEENVCPWVAGADMAHVKTLKNAFLVIRNGLIEDFGAMNDYLAEKYEEDDLLTELDCSGKMVFPAYCDSHTHLVFPASRESEFVDKIKGLSYEEIARRGGGILNSAQRMAEISEDELYEQALERVSEIIATGTGAVEIKSGYGLSTESELKMLRVIDRLKKNTPLTIVSTFLGAHALPLEYRNNREGYIDLLVNEMIPVIASEQLADYIDVFCDEGFFTVQETEQILMAGMKYGLRPKIHANELALSGGVQVGVKYNALSVDHLEFIEEAEIDALKGSETMPTVLPGAAFFLDLKLTPVRRMMEAGLPIALASDYNPGSSPSGNMNFIQSLGCIRYKMLPEEVINATTINTAYAMGLSETHGSIARGKVANVFVTKEIPSYSFIPYSFGSNPVETVILNGEIV